MISRMVNATALWTLGEAAAWSWECAGGWRRETFPPLRRPVRMEAKRGSPARAQRVRISARMCSVSKRIPKKRGFALPQEGALEPCGKPVRFAFGYALRVLCNQNRHALPRVFDLERLF